ncbi:MAG: 3'(2'),5'-bisphosphate nucleotidase CysQ [Acidobacteria bacterium]|nr:3'(2'),5'-bisphosphate nucleotidase CysQ [Acidobacteriota bacterium]
MLNQELETAIDLARRAGAAILEFYRNGFEAEEKIGADNFTEPVTIADRTASRIIVDGLETKFPSDGILSEEEPDTHHRLDRKRVWMIDPLDGTAGFIKRDGDFAVQIGLVEDRKPVLGVVFLPNEDTLLFAAKDSGAFRTVDGGSPQRLEVSGQRHLSRITMAASRNHYSKRMSRVVDEFRVAREVRRGSVGLKVGLIAAREADLYIHLSPRTKQWDTCAPEIILEEAGGRLTDIFGREIKYNTRDIQNHNGILASNGALHSKSVDRLKPLLDQFDRRPFRHE